MTSVSLPSIAICHFIKKTSYRVSHTDANNDVQTFCRSACGIYVRVLRGSNELGAACRSQGGWGGWGG